MDLQLKRKRALVTGSSSGRHDRHVRAAKAGLGNMTVSLPKKLARSAVAVYTVSPGCTCSAMFERTLETMAKANGWPADCEFREKLFMDLGMFPCLAERYGRPGEVGALVALIASPNSGFINRANYRIDSGQCQSVN